MIVLVIYALADAGWGWAALPLAGVSVIILGLIPDEVAKTEFRCTSEDLEWLKKAEDLVQVRKGSR